MTELSVARHILSTLELAGRAKRVGRTDDTAELIGNALDMNPPEGVWRWLEMMPPNIYGATNEAREHLAEIERARIDELQGRVVVEDRPYVEWLVSGDGPEMSDELYDHPIDLLEDDVD